MDRRITIGLALLLIIALARYIAVAFFIHPFADDFSYAVAGMHNDLFKRLADEYQFWNGRWFSNILVLRGPLVLGMQKGLWLNRLVPVAMLALTWCGFFALIRAWVDAWAMPRGTVALGASLFLLLYLHLMPDLSEGIYWYTGAVSYQLPGALMLLLAAGWVRMLDTVSVKRPRLVVPLVLLAVVICGCSELHMVYMVLFHTALLIVPKSRWFHVRKYVAVVLVCVIIAALVMFLAPGNAGRSAQFAHRHQIGHTLLWGALQTGRFLLTWIASPALLICSLLYLSVCGWVISRAGLFVVVGRVHPAWFALFLVGIVFISMALPYWSTGLLGQHRTVNATLLFFLPCWFLLLTLIHLRWFRYAPLPFLLPMQQRVAACALLAVVVFATGTGGRVTRDLLDGGLRDFDNTLVQRYALIENARNEGALVLVIPDELPTPRSLRYLDGGSDPEQWINRSIAQYFGAENMRIAIASAPSTPTAPAAPR